MAWIKILAACIMILVPTVSVILLIRWANRNKGKYERNPNCSLARYLAAKYHGKQTRDDEKTPYYTHPWRVGDRLESMGWPSKDMICAGYLHDVVEDANITLKEIGRRFGLKVAMLVDELTNRPHPPDMCRADRKAVDRMRLSGACSEAKLIKLIDRIDNLKDLKGKSPYFVETYKEESLLLLHCLHGTHRELEGELELLCKEDPNGQPKR